MRSDVRHSPELGCAGWQTPSVAPSPRYNPPPNWPPPPPGWSPPPGWQPDPAWGPLPPGWQLWTTERANRRAWAWAFGVAGGLYVISLLAGLLLTRGGLSAATAGAYLGRYAVAGLATALIARVRPRRWSWWLYLLVVIGFVAVLGALTAVGQNASR